MIVGELAERAEVVEDPEGAAVGGDDEIVVLDDEIVDRGGGQIQFERAPVCAVVEGNIDAGFGSGVEQAALLGIFANGANEGAIGNAVGELGPGLAVVGGFVDVGFEVVALVAIDGDVGGAGVERRSVDEADAAPLRHIFGSDVGPGLCLHRG